MSGILIFGDDMSNDECGNDCSTCTSCGPKQVVQQDVLSSKVVSNIKVVQDAADNYASVWHWNQSGAAFDPSVKVGVAQKRLQEAILAYGRACYYQAMHDKAHPLSVSPTQVGIMFAGNPREDVAAAAGVIAQEIDAAIVADILTGT